MRRGEWIGYSGSCPYSTGELLAEVRFEIADIMGLMIDYTEPDAIRDRFSELFEEKARRDDEKKQAEARKALRAA